MSANRVQVADIYTFTRNEFLSNDNMKKNQRKGRNILFVYCHVWKINYFACLVGLCLIL